MPRRLPALLLALTIPAALATSAPEHRPLREVAVHPQRGAQAQVVSLNESRIAAEIAAPVTALPVEPGQVIGKGAVVARLECRDYELETERSRATLKVSEARAKLAAMQGDRARRLADEKFISGELLDTRLAEADAARAEVAAGQSALRIAENNRSKCVVRAPFAAIVAERLGQVGEMAAPGTPLVSLIDRSRIEVKAEIQQADVADLGRARDLRFTGIEGEMPVILVRTSPAVSRTTRQVEARLRFVKQAARPGSGGRLLWTTSLPHVPPNLVVRRQGRLGIYLWEAGKARFLPLPEADEGRAAPVNLPDDTRIVVRGQHELP